MQIRSKDQEQDDYMTVGSFWQVAPARLAMVPRRVRRQGFWVHVGQTPRQRQRNDVDTAELPRCVEPFRRRGPIEGVLDKASNGRRW